MRRLTRLILPAGGPGNAPAKRRASLRGRRFLSAKAQRTCLRLGAAAAIVGGALAVPTWWVWSGGLERAWTEAQRAAEQGVVHLTAELGLTVGEVFVEGRERTSLEALREVLGVRRGQAIVSVDLDEVRARVEALPWVRAAAIERRLPDSLYVRIAERRPLALWQRDGKLALIDQEGVVIYKRAGQEFAALPVVVGADAPAHAARLLDMLASERTLKDQVRAAVRVGGRRWNLRLRSGIEVRLPEEGAEKAWQRLADEERRHGLLGRDVIAVDLRFPDRLVVRTTHPAGPRRNPRRAGINEKST